MRVKKPASTEANTNSKKRSPTLRGKIKLSFGSVSIEAAEHSYTNNCSCIRQKAAHDGLQDWFFYSLCYPMAMKADLRLSVMDYSANKDQLLCISLTNF